MLCIHFLCVKAGRKMRDHCTAFILATLPYDLKVCDDGTLVQILSFWTLSIVLS
jgi:hypothetical protein